MEEKPSSKYEKKYLYKISNINQLEDILTNGISPDLDSGTKRIPNAYRIRDYVHLSMNIKSIKDNNDDLCILCIDKAVLDLNKTIISDHEASKAWVHYYTPAEAFDHTLELSAEVMTYGYLNSKYIIGILAASVEAKDRILAINSSMKVLIKPEFFK